MEAVKIAQGHRHSPEIEPHLLGVLSRERNQRSRLRLLLEIERIMI